MNLRRKRLRLMRDTQWRGYLRTAEGNPITLSQVRSMANLSVLGNSAQSGTPSPDNPVEVVGSGERTTNLFDVSQITSNSGGYVNNNKIYVINYSFAAGITPQKFLEMTGLQIGDTFTCCAQYTLMQDCSSGATYVNFVPKKSGLTGLTLFDYASFSDRNNGFMVSTIPSDFNNDNYYGLYFYGGNISTPIEGEVRAILSNFAIYKGEYTAETLPPYEPYGYKVAVQASRRNLFTALGRKISDVKDSGPMAKRVFGDNVIIESISRNGYVASYNKVEYAISDNVIEIYPSSGSGYGLGFDIDVFAGEQYSIRFTVIVGTADVSMSYYDADGVFISSTYRISSTGTVFSSVVPDGAKKMILTFSETYGQTERHIKLSDIMLVEGSYTAETLPPYEPYKEPQSFNIYTMQPLHGVGNAHDSVVLDFDKNKAELVRKVSCGKFNGEEDWYITSEATDISKYYISTDIVKPGNTYDRRTLSNIAMYNNELNKKNQVNAYGFTGGNGWIGFAVDTNIYPLIDDFKSFLKLMYTNNNPVTVYVDCKDTPIITDITDLQQWDTLPDLKGTWILTANGGTEPTLTAEYYSNERSTE